MEFLVMWVILCGLVAVYASGRGRSAFGWFVLSVVLSPLICFLILLALANLKAQTPALAFAGGDAYSADTHVRCPDCRELVRKDACKCRHCGAALIPQ